MRILLIVLLLSGCTLTIHQDKEVGQCFIDYNEFYVRKITNVLKFNYEYCMFKGDKNKCEETFRMRKKIFDKVMTEVDCPKEK